MEEVLSRIMINLIQSKDLYKSNIEESVIKMLDVITVGSGLIDLFLETGDRLFQKVKRGGKEDVVHVPFGSKIYIKEVRIDTGGGGTNTAVSFSKMGLRTGFIGLLGRDKNADRIVDELKKNKIKVLVKKRADRDNGFSVILDAKGHDRTILSYKGVSNGLGKDMLPRMIKTKWFYFSTMLGKSYMTQKYLSEYAKRKDIKIMFNPSFYLAKKGVGFLRPILKNTEILILNVEESGYISKGSIEKRLKSLMGLGPKIVIITDGPKGAYLLNEEMYYKIIPHNIKVIEATGAGDSFASGFLAGFIRTGEIERSMQIGLANAQSVITHFGAKNKLLKWEEALEIIKKRKARIIKKKIK